MGVEACLKLCSLLKLCILDSTKASLSLLKREAGVP